MAFFKAKEKLGNLFGSAPEVDVDTLKTEHEKGLNTAGFVDSVFYRTVYQPLVDRYKKALIDQLQTPQENSFVQGKLAMLHEMERDIQEIINKGMKAKEKLDELEEANV